MNGVYLNHLQSSSHLVTTYEAVRAGFVALALEKNRRMAPYIAEARALKIAASLAKTPFDLLKIDGIKIGLLTAAGLSEKALSHLLPEDKEEAIKGLVENFLEPAGEKFVEELVFRFLLTRGDTLGGSMRNLGGVLAQQKITQTILATLSLGGISYQWQEMKSKKWFKKDTATKNLEQSLRGLSWEGPKGERTLIYNLTPPLVKNNIDLCLFNQPPHALTMELLHHPESYLAMGELKGGIDPAGADEHWKTAQAALARIRDAFRHTNFIPHTFFIGASIEKRMADEIWSQLKNGTLSNAANLNELDQLGSLCRWLCYL